MKYGNMDVLKDQMPDVSDYKPWIKIVLQLQWQHKHDF